VPFYPKKNKKSINLGNGEPDHFEFSDNKPFETYKNYPGQVYFYILSLSSLFFDEEPLENILCIQRRPAHAKPDFNSFSCPRNGT